MSAHARRTDPVTSHEAAASLGSDQIRLSQFGVLTILRTYGPMTDSTLVMIYDGHHKRFGLPAQSESGIRTRRRELVDMGRVRDSGRTVPLSSGRSSIIWEISP